MEENKELLGVGYMRIDRVGDVQETERQSLSILSHCHEHDVKLLAFFLDEGSRGKGWKALEDLVKSGGGLDRVVVAEMERVSAGGKELALDKDSGISKG